MRAPDRKPGGGTGLERDFVVQVGAEALARTGGRLGALEPPAPAGGGGGFQRAKPASGPRESFSADLDDEIPF